MTTNTLAGPEVQAFWDSSTNQELHNKWTKTWGPDSGNLKKRYTSKQLGTDQVIPVTGGARSNMVNLERWLVENDPGPMNREPWAGKG